MIGWLAVADIILFVWWYFSMEDRDVDFPARSFIPPLDSKANAVNPCSECFFCQKDPEYLPDMWTCLHPKSDNLKRVMQMRSVIGKCGPDGQWYKPVE